MTVNLGEAARQAASGLAIAMLERNLKKGRSIHIPSLGITIEGDRMSEPLADTPLWTDEEVLRTIEDLGLGSYEDDVLINMVQGIRGEMQQALAAAAAEHAAALARVEQLEDDNSQMSDLLDHRLERETEMERNLKARIDELERMYKGVVELNERNARDALNIRQGSKAAMALVMATLPAFEEKDARIKELEAVINKNLQAFEAFDERILELEAALTDLRETGCYPMPQMASGQVTAEWSAPTEDVWDEILKDENDNG